MYAKCMSGRIRVGKKSNGWILKEFFCHVKAVEYLESGDRHLQICAFENIKQTKL